jgi:hypothetical protein
VPAFCHDTLARTRDYATNKAEETVDISVRPQIEMRHRGAAALAAFPVWLPSLGMRRIVLSGNHTTQQGACERLLYGMRKVRNNSEWLEADDVLTVSEAEG